MTAAGAAGGATLGKDLLALEPLTAEQIRLILDTAEPLKEISERQIKKVPTLRGKTITVAPEDRVDVLVSELDGRDAVVVVRRDGAEAAR